jgi:hypothetical protein
MHIKVKYESGKKSYSESVESGTAKVRRHAKSVSAYFGGSGKASGTITMAKDDAERLAYSLLSACCTEDTFFPFPFGTPVK